MRLQQPEEDGTSSLLAGVGRATEQDLYAVLPHPLADNSAMDGFAVNARLLVGASRDSPVFLPILGRILAGELPPPTGSPTQDGCWEVMTGGIIPSEAFDAVIKVEDVLPSDSTSDSLGRLLVGFTTPVKSGQHFRRQGEQFHAGDLLLRAGEVIAPEHVMLLAAAGITSVQARTSARPRREIERRVAILTTGKEVVPFNDFARGARIETGQVIDCITPFLQATLLSRGCEPVLLASAGDSATALRASLDAALESGSFDLIITVAGVSLGSADYTPAVLASLGLEEIFHGVAIRPGGPVMLSRHRASDTPVLSLPGNPMASAVCLQSFGAAILDGSSPYAGGEGWSELDLGHFSEEEEEEQNASWQDWLERLKPGMSTFAALPVSDQGMPTLRGVLSAGRRTGPCALGSLIGAGAWVRADRAASRGGKDKVFWRPF